MAEPSKVSFDSLLKRSSEGDEQAREELYERASRELRSRASAMMRQQRNDHIWQTSDLLNEGFPRTLHVIDGRADVPGANYFFQVAITAMKRTLIDHTRYRNAQVRNRGGKPSPLDDHLDAIRAGATGFGLLEIEDALENLRKSSDRGERQAAVFEMRVVGRLSMAEIAAKMRISPPTVRSDYGSARQALWETLRDGTPG